MLVGMKVLVNLKNSKIDQSQGIVMSEDLISVKVMITTGDKIGKAYILSKLQVEAI